jgi:hypothetical protein
MGTTQRAVSGKPLTFGDLVRAWRDMRFWSRAHPDLRGFYLRRYRALAAAFDVDLDIPPSSNPPMPDWLVEWHEAQGHRRVPPLEHPVWWGRWPEDLHGFVVRADERARTLEGPFAGYLEQPPALSAAADRFGRGIAEPLRVAHGRIAAMIVELLAALYPDAAARTVTVEELRGAGFDPDAARPDPVDARGRSLRTAGASRAGEQLDLGLDARSGPKLIANPTRPPRSVNGYRASVTR